MCIVFIFTDTNPEKGSYRLIVASNRDEYYQRPAECAHFYPEDNIIAGKDLEKSREGGTWLGVSMRNDKDFKFRFGALLNVTGEEKKDDSKGRGFIVMDYIKGNLTAKEYIEILSVEAKERNAYNFIAVELSENSATTFYQSNSPLSCSKFEGKQILSFSNSPLDTPFTKVKNGKDRFADIVSRNNTTTQNQLLKSDLISLLKWNERHLPDPELERRAPLAFEHLSSVYVQYLEYGYGTRTHSVILVDDEWNVEFLEETMQEPCNPNSADWFSQCIKAKI